MLRLAGHRRTQILEEHGNAAERSVGQFSRRLLDRGVEALGDDRVERGVGGLDTGDGGGHEFGRRDGARPNEVGLGDGVERGQFVVHVVNVLGDRSVGSVASPT